jgi:hypothetical protein
VRLEELGKIRLRSMLSSTSTFCYPLAGFLRKVLSPVAGKSESFIKNFDHFIQLL